MKPVKPSTHTTRWFYLIASGFTLIIFFWMIQSFILTLITASVFAIVLAPVDRKFARLLKNRTASAITVVVGVFLLVLVPTFVAGVLIVQEAGDIVSSTIADEAWVQRFDLASQPLFTLLPLEVQTRVLEIDVVKAGKGIADWAFRNVGGVLSGGAQMMVNVFIFFMALFYLLVGRERIREEVLLLSPFKDRTDVDIMGRVVATVRGVVFGSLIIGVIQAIIASIGLAIFGVPGALFWGALAVIAAQIPTIGLSIIMIPAVVYLAVTGQVGAAIGLAIWAAVAVGLADNVLSPKIIGGRVKMPELLVLISILGGLSAFGPIGLIVGPTVLALVFVFMDLYKHGILERPMR